MHTIDQYDIAILGGGLAGLSLAAELCAPCFAHLKIVVIEPRAEYRRDKTWSYWRQSSVDGAPFDYREIESATWPAWRVAEATKNVTINTNKNTNKADNFVYASINGDAFYQAALAKINACSHVSLLQNELVDSLRAEAGKVVVALKSAKNIIINQFIFDSRPVNQSAIHLQKSHLSQHFLGLEIKADSAIFNRDCVELMQFQTADHGIHFMYVLPYSTSHALIESTWICQHHHHADYTQELNEYLTKTWPKTHFEINYTESGSLPLLTENSRKNSIEYWLGGVQVIPIGSLAGTARAATGYAFLETLSDNKRLALAVKNHKPLFNQLIPQISKAIPAFRRNKIDAWMDAQFLSFLSQHAALGPSYFVQMFSNCQPASLIRFLTGQANLQDRLRVIWAMPSLPMIKHLFGLKV